MFRHTDLRCRDTQCRSCLPSREAGKNARWVAAYNERYAGEEWYQTTRYEQQTHAWESGVHRSRDGEVTINTFTALMVQQRA